MITTFDNYKSPGFESRHSLNYLLIYRSIRLTIVKIKRSYQIKRKIKDVIDMINITLILPKQTQIYVIHMPLVC